MAQRTKVNFKATKNADFADNITGDITALKIRNILEDIADSFLGIADVIIQLKAPTANQTITTGYAGYIYGEYEIANGISLEIENNADFEIG